MAGIKRRVDNKAVGTTSLPAAKKQKTVTSKTRGKHDQPSKDSASRLSNSSGDEDSAPDKSFSDNEAAGPATSQSDHDEVDSEEPKPKAKAGGQVNADGKFKLNTSSADAHAAQRALAKERKAGKPNADVIARSKKIWERLRRKSHVPLEERKELVAELYAIVNGRVRDFVFKHDSVRVIQCALKYANKEQRLNITRELQADIRPLVESKYGKFMVAKIVVEGDEEVRDLVIPEFYGHVRRLINHPEAAWILDDIYRQVATKDQKAKLLREWYGAEFALDNKMKDTALKTGEKPTDDLSTILAKSPEKRKPILQYLHQLINQLVQKKLSGFTMLHDAMFQYFTNVPPGSEEANEFLENLKSDLDDPSGGGDLLKNLAFTKSGSRVVCQALAYGSAKDRKQIIRVYRDIMEAMSSDAHAYNVLLAALEVTDDTKMSAKSIYSELLFENINDDAERDDRVLGILTHLTGRIPVLYPLAGDSKWLLTPATSTALADVHRIRETTSKKAPATRRAELTAYLAAPLLSLISRQAEILAQSTTGCAAIAEILLEGGSAATEEQVSTAVAAVAALCGGDPNQEGHISHTPAAGKMLRALCQGGKFDSKMKTVIKPARPLGSAEAVYDVIEAELIGWATGPSSFVVVALVENESLDRTRQEGLIRRLRHDREALSRAAEGKGTEKPNAGARILVEKFGKA